MRAIRRKFSRSNRPLLPYMRPTQELVRPTPMRPTQRPSWNFSNFLTRLNPLRHLRSAANSERRLTSVEEGLTSDEDFDVEPSTQTRFQTSFQTRNGRATSDSLWAPQIQEDEDEIVNRMVGSFPAPEKVDQPSTPFQSTLRLKDDTLVNLVNQPLTQKRQAGNGRPLSTSSWTQWSTQEGETVIQPATQKRQTGNGHASTSAAESFQVQGTLPATIMPSTEFTHDAERNYSQNLDAVTDFLMSNVNKPISVKSIDRIVTLLDYSKEDTNQFHNWSSSEILAPPPAPLVPSVSIPRKFEWGPNRNHALGSIQLAPSRSGYCRLVSDTSSTSSCTAPNDPSPLQQAWTGNSPPSSESGSSEESVTFDQTELTQMGLPTARKIVEQIEKELAKEMKIAKEMEMVQQTGMEKHKEALAKRTDGQNKDGIRVQTHDKTLTRPSKRKRPARERVPAESLDDNDSQTREISLLEFIQATVPQGSSRSRPIVVDDDEEEDVPVPKRFKSRSNRQTPRDIIDVEMQPAQTIEEMVDVEMQSALSEENHSPFNVPVPLTSGRLPIPAHNVPVPPTSGWLPVPAQSSVGPKSSMPKEPSKLRFSVQPESTMLVPEPRMTQVSPEVNFAPSVPVPTLMVTPSIPAQVVPPTSTVCSAFIRKIDSKYTAGAQQLPNFVFASPVNSTISNSEVRSEAQSAVKATLPGFDITRDLDD